MTEMPVDVMDLTDQEMFEISLSENLKRVGYLSPIEKAAALKHYMDEFHATSAQAAQLFGIPEGTIRGTVRLLKLPEEVQAEIAERTAHTERGADRFLERPETEQRRLEPKDGVFDLREKLMILVYDRYRSDVSDELLFKKIQAIVEENKQLTHQIDKMNGRRIEGSRVGPSRPSIQHVSVHADR